MKNILIIGVVAMTKEEYDAMATMPGAWSRYVHVYPIVVAGDADVLPMFAQELAQRVIEKESMADIFENDDIEPVRDMDVIAPAVLVRSSAGLAYASFADWQPRDTTSVSLQEAFEAGRKLG